MGSFLVAICVAASAPNKVAEDKDPKLRYLKVFMKARSEQTAEVGRVEILNEDVSCFGIRINRIFGRFQLVIACMFTWPLYWRLAS
jgi:hypothetical protein